MDEQTWLVPGAKVVEISHGSRTLSARETEILRVGKRDVVLRNGSRFNKARLERSVGEWGSYVKLEPRDSAAAQEALVHVARAMVKRSMWAALESYAGELRTTPEAEVPDPADLVKRLQGLYDTLPTKES